MARTNRNFYSLRDPQCSMKGSIIQCYLLKVKKGRDEEKNGIKVSEERQTEGGGDKRERSIGDRTQLRRRRKRSLRGSLAGTRERENMKI